MYALVCKKYLYEKCFIVFLSWMLKNIHNLVFENHIFETVHGKKSVRTFQN